MIVKTRIMGISCLVFRFIGEISRFLLQSRNISWQLYLFLGKTIPNVHLSTGFTPKIGTVGLGCLEYTIISLAKTQCYIKRWISIFAFCCFPINCKSNFQVSNSLAWLNSGKEVPSWTAPHFSISASFLGIKKDRWAAYTPSVLVRQSPGGD